MYLTRPDGTSWGVDWDRVVLPLLHRALESRASKLGGGSLLPDGSRGIVVLDGEGREMWPEWSKGFLHAEWNGSDFSESTGRRLLALSGGTGDDNHNLAHDAEVRERPPPTPGPDESFETTRGHHGSVAGWIDETAPVEPSTPTILPDDSVSCVGRRLNRLTRLDKPRLEPLVEEDELSLDSRASRERRGTYDEQGQNFQLYRSHTATQPVRESDIGGGGGCGCGGGHTLENLLVTIREGMEDLDQSQVAVRILGLQSVLAASRGDRATARELKAVADEIATERTSRARQLVQMDRHLDLLYYDRHIAGPKSADGPTRAWAAARAREDAALRSGITRRPLPWSGKLWQNFSWYTS